MNKKIKQIGDKVWVSYGGKIERAEIKTIVYRIRIQGGFYYETDSTKVFDSKEELIESLSK